MDKKKCYENYTSPNLSSRISELELLRCAGRYIETAEGMFLQANLIEIKQSQPGAILELAT